jgi:hypothetical protein
LGDGGYGGQLRNRILSIIYSPVGTGFGDIWRATNTALVTSEQVGNPVGISIRKFGNGEREYFIDLGGRIKSAIDSNGNVFLTGERHTRNGKRYNYPYLPTKNCWKKTDQNTIAFSLKVGVTSTTRLACKSGKKFPPDSDKWPDSSYEEVMTSFCDASFNEVGLPLSMEQSMDVMSRSMFFFGFESGMAHLARAMKIPTFIVVYNKKRRRKARQWHKGDDHVLCKGTKTFLEEAKAFLQREHPGIGWECCEI